MNYTGQNKFSYQQLFSRGNATDAFYAFLKNELSGIGWGVQNAYSYALVETKKNIEPFPGLDNFGTWPFWTIQPAFGGPPVSKIPIIVDDARGFVPPNGYELIITGTTDASVCHSFITSKITEMDPQVQVSLQTSGTKTYMQYVHNPPVNNYEIPHPAISLNTSSPNCWNGGFFLVTADQQIGMYIDREQTQGDIEVFFAPGSVTIQQPAVITLAERGERTQLTNSVILGSGQFTLAANPYQALIEGDDHWAIEIGSLNCPQSNLTAAFSSAISGGISSPASFRKNPFCASTCMLLIKNGVNYFPSNDLGPQLPRVMILYQNLPWENGMSEIFPQAWMAFGMADGESGLILGKMRDTIVLNGSFPYLATPDFFWDNQSWHIVGDNATSTLACISNADTQPSECS